MEHFDFPTRQLVRGQQLNRNQQIGTNTSLQRKKGEVVRFNRDRVMTTRIIKFDKS